MPEQPNESLQDEILAEFVVESREGLDRLDLDLVDLEREPSSTEIVTSIFRTMHTIKGSSGFLGFTNLEQLTHAAENLLARVREGHVAVSQPVISAMLAAGDAVRAHLARIEESGAESTESHDELRATLEALCDAGPAAPAPAVEAREEEAEERGTTAALQDSTIRVDVSILDSLMNLVGELVLARNQILQFTADQQDATFLATSQQLNLITTELQEGVMKTRMQPIGNVWSKFPRVVRDLALTCGKQVRIEMEGEETELDKTIIEAIKDPLTHIVRNSIDHGIETPEQRVAAGKPAEGVLCIRAFHEGGQVIIEIADDGAGLDMARIQAKAVERGVLTADAASRLSDRDTANLIFLPGFSTAEKVTSISGRGVGMDVVKTNIEKIGGTLDVQSTPGRGTTLRVKIPLTLAIIPALVVTCGEDRYAIPQVNLVELLRVEPEQVANAIESVGGAPVYRLRGRLLPMLYLREIFGLPCDEDRSGVHNIVVLQADDRQFGLVVDHISDTAEIVVKPLGPHLKGIAAFAGTTIMGDGTVALILDAIGVAQHGGVLSELRGRQIASEPEQGNERRGNTQTLLVCSAGSSRLALPIALVSRLEEFDVSLVERAAGQHVIQYRDGLLVLVPLRTVLEPDLGDPLDTGGQPLQVLVHTRDDRTYGFVVDEIVDIVEADLSRREPSGRPGIGYSAVVGRRVTDLVDIDRVIDSYCLAAGETVGAPA